MKTKLSAVLFTFLLSLFVINTNAQSLSPKVIASAGGYFSAGGYSLSWTLGETMTTTLSAGGYQLTQGFQQPFILFTVLDVKAYLQGYYSGVGTQNALLFNLDPGSHDPDDCDSITIELYEENAPYAFVASEKGIINDDGTASLRFSTSLLGNSYYVVFQHRHSLETWSANPVEIQQNTYYSFADLQTSAYGNNLIATSDNLYFAVYGGDHNKDGAIDGSDYLELDPQIQNGEGGYAQGDYNGDGAVDGGDFLLLDPNIQNGIGINRP